MSEEVDRISETFRNRTILITGGSGFLGNVLTEKLLRCTEVKKMYLLMRTKHGKSPQERLCKIFDNMLFETLKKQKPNALDKVEIIFGDIVRKDLGISAEDASLLQEEVELIYHAAATVKFDEPVKTAIKLNTRSTKLLLDFAEKCKNLLFFMYVSTAYAFPKEEILYEKAYNPPMDPQAIVQLVDSDCDDQDCEKYLEDSPNSYTFSKAIAEHAVVAKMETLPAVIVRPSIVCPIWRDPVPGWTNNLQGPMGLLVAGGKGVLRSIYVKNEYCADFITADVVINGMMAVTWNYLCNSKKDKIFNLTNSGEYSISWQKIIETGEDLATKDIPFNGVVWYPRGSIKSSKTVHLICFYLFHLFPAFLVDTVLKICGRKPILFPILLRIKKGLNMFEYYVTRPWNFHNFKFKGIKEHMNSKEQEIYKIDCNGFDCRQYIRNGILSVRRNNLKEGDDTIQGAKRHMKRLWLMDLALRAFLVLILFFYVYEWF